MARLPESKLGANANKRHKAKLRKAKRSQNKDAKPTHGAQNRPKSTSVEGWAEPAHRSSASGTRCDVRARPTKGRVAPAKGNAKLPERPRDEGGPREARPASLRGLVGQVPEQRQGRGPKAPEGPTSAQRAGRRTPAATHATWRIPGQPPGG
jgi:hypothetical protein